MELTRAAAHGVPFVEGAPQMPFLREPRDFSRLIEACLSAGAGAAVLYSSNLPPAFLDLSSGLAGDLLQKLQNYGIRLAVVRENGAALSSRFGDMLAEARRLRLLTVVDARADALAWIEETA